MPNSTKSSYAWFLATRPRTLPISVGPIVVAIALAISQGISINWWIAWMTLCFSLFIQIGTNLVNDALDFKKGADKEDRLGPLRVTQSGILSYQQVMGAGWGCFFCAFVCGIPLMMAGGWILAFVIAFSIASGYLYTGGPYPLGYIGISDFFVLLFFGWVSTCTVYYLQTGTVDRWIFLAGTQLGLLAIVPHAINYLRDRLTDERADKKTFAVRFGMYATRWWITFLSLFPFILGIFWVVHGFVAAAVLPLVLLIPIGINLKNIWTQEPGKNYNGYLAKSALCQFTFSLLLAVAFFL